MSKEYTVRAVEDDENHVELVLVCNGFDIDQATMFPRNAEADLIADQAIMWVESYDMPHEMIGDIAAGITMALADSTEPDIDSTLY